MKITPYNKFIGSSRTGTITSGTMQLNKAYMTKAIGFKPNQDDDGDKVTASWGLMIDDKLCACWDYKGSFRYGQISAYGDHDAWEKFCAAKGLRYERG